MEPGKTYVVAFLNDGEPTGPGLSSSTVGSLVYLTSLQKTCMDAIFLGVTTDEDSKLVALRVAERAGKLDFRLAVGARDELGGKMESRLAR